MGRGGRRAGAGRPAGQGKYGEATKAIRVPESLVRTIYSFIANNAYKIPLYTSKVRAGFPSPADDHIEAKLDLNEHLIFHPASTFFVRVSGDSMKNVGIHSNDILIVDKSVEATNNKVVIAAINGELTVKRLQIKGKKKYLVAENPNYKPIELNEANDNYIWGVVLHVIHSF
ncbi:MAG: umuD1 [Gammaproteobacteria bacterium]|jgi:DNA polymerase V|nr:umuD1 [Gammaproteobacteria bacterium]